MIGQKMNHSKDRLRDRLDPRTTALLLFAILVGAGVASRILLMDWPNFKPMAAIAIFCGFLFSTRWLAVLAVVVMLLISDALTGFYELPLMIGVYTSMVLALCLGCGLRGFMRARSFPVQTTGVVCASLAASVLFFVLTNSAVWAAGWYPPTVDGLMQSYAAGIPFFRFTVAGDLLFSLLLFSCWFALSGSGCRSIDLSGRNHEISRTDSLSTSKSG